MVRFRVPSILFGVCAVALLCWPVQAREEAWVQVTSPHFTVSSNSGEKTARRIASECEEIRAVFQSSFPNLRIDAGKPLVVIAVKDETSLKILLPDYWAEKNRVHPPGMFQAGIDENFAVLRTDLYTKEGENPYAALYEDYVFSILQLNYDTLPLWLRLGIATYYGNTIVDDKYTDVGRPTHAQLVELQKSALVPVAELMNADARSLLYNDREKAPILYAESWAIVHYLTLDPEASKQHYLTTYLKAWKETNDGAESARRTFGDLVKFQDTIDRYVRQLAFHYERRPAANLLESEYKVRAMSSAEALEVQADFLQHTNHMPEARDMLRQALSLQPDFPALHACIGYDDYLLHNNDDARKEFEQAMTSDPQDFRSPYRLAQIALRSPGYGLQGTPIILGYLETAIQRNPDFAPAYAFLSVAYRQQPETKQKALNAAIKASLLAPANLAYVADIGDALIALDRDADARAIADKLNKGTGTPQEKDLAESYSKRLAHYEEDAQRKKSQGAEAQAAESGPAPVSHPTAGTPSP